MKTLNKKVIIEDEKEKMRKQGKRNKNKGSNFERKIANKLKEKYQVDFVRTPLSGGFSKTGDTFKGDISVSDDNLEMKLHIECKNSINWNLKSWIEQAEKDCPSDRKIAVVFHKNNTNKDYVCLNLDDFLEMIPKNCVVIER